MTCPSCGAPHSENISCGYCETYPEVLLSEEQQNSPYVRDLVDHKGRVRAYMQMVAGELMRRSYIHDNSKFEPEEFDAYNEAFPNLQKYAYGTDEFKAELKKIEPAIQHHYSVNDHHPEYHADGIVGMSLIQIIEMVCDWLAASERSQANIYQGMEMNRKRFGIDVQLINAIARTIMWLKDNKEGQQP